MNNVDWRGYETKDKPAVGAHLREVNFQVIAAARPAEVGDGDYSPANESKSTRNLSLETYHGIVVDDFDHIEKQIQLYLLHRILVSSEHRSKKYYERNAKPWIVQKDMDFYENGAIEMFYKAQFECWQTFQYTLFMSM